MFHGDKHCLDHRRHHFWPDPNCRDFHHCWSYVHHGDRYRHDLIASGFLVVFISAVFRRVSGPSRLIYLLKTFPGSYVKTCVISHITSEVNSVVRLQTWFFQVTLERDGFINRKRSSLSLPDLDHTCNASDVKLDAVSTPCKLLFLRLDLALLYISNIIVYYVIATKTLISTMPVYRGHELAAGHWSTWDNTSQG